MRLEGGDVTRAFMRDAGEYARGYGHFSAERLSSSRAETVTERPLVRKRLARVTGEPQNVITGIYDSKSSCIQVRDEQKIPGECLPLRQRIHAIIAHSDCFATRRRTRKCQDSANS